MISRFIETIGNRMPESLQRYIPVTAYSFDDFSEKIGKYRVTIISAFPVEDHVIDALPNFHGFFMIADYIYYIYQTKYTGISENGRQVTWLETHETLKDFGGERYEHDRDRASKQSLITALDRLNRLYREHPSVNMYLIDPIAGALVNEQLMQRMNEYMENYQIRPHALPTATR